MELKRKKKMENIILGIIFIVVIILYNIRTKEKEEYQEKLLANAYYSIGEVSKYFPRKMRIFNNTGRSANVEYHFMANAKEYTNKYTASDAKVPDEGVSVGERFLVLYLKDNPEESRMFFEYPVKDSIDFKRYVKEFEEMKNKKK